MTIKNQQLSFETNAGEWQVPVETIAISCNRMYLETQQTKLLIQICNVWCLKFVLQLEQGCHQSEGCHYQFSGGKPAVVLYLKNKW